jgi:sec-independent protein translocase protein TatB
VFGIGLTEFAVIAVVATLVFGPERLPDLARQAGRLLRQARRLAEGARDELRSELGPGYEDLELADLDPRRIIRRHLTDALDDLDSTSTSTSTSAPAAEGEATPPTARTD